MWFSVVGRRDQVTESVLTCWEGGQQVGGLVCGVKLNLSGDVYGGSRPISGSALLHVFM